jgi:hypothetical protein
MLLRPSRQKNHFFSYSPQSLNTTCIFTTLYSILPHPRSHERTPFECSPQKTHGAAPSPQSSIWSSYIVGIECFSDSSHQASTKGELSGETHACRESKWIHNEHRFLRIQELHHGSEILFIIADLSHLLGSSRRLARRAFSRAVAPRFRKRLGHWPCWFAVPTPLLSSRNQSRTNTVPCKEITRVASVILVDVAAARIANRRWSHHCENSREFVGGDELWEEDAGRDCETSYPRLLQIFLNR